MGHSYNKQTTNQSVIFHTSSPFHHTLRYPEKGDALMFFNACVDHPTTPLLGYIRRFPKSWGYPLFIIQHPSIDGIFPWKSTIQRAWDTTEIAMKNPPFDLSSTFSAPVTYRWRLGDSEPAKKWIVDLGTQGASCHHWISQTSGDPWKSQQKSQLR